MKRPWPLIFVVAILAGVFCPTVFGEFISADDTGMIESWSQSSLGLYDLFFGPRANLFYYRPILVSTFYLDKILWGLDPLAMRFENVLIHISSAVFVYAILTSVFRSEQRNDSWAPLLGALLFGLNPVVTESVNWVSGRSDLLAAWFLLLCTYALVKYKDGGSWLLLVIAVLSWVLGVLCKEVAFAYAPGVVLLLTSACRDKVRSRRVAQVWLRPFALICIVLASVVLLFYLRSFAVLSSASNVGETLRIIFNDPLYSCTVAFRLLGFYLKKIFFPWPQSFAILDVDPVYELLGMVLTVVCVWSLFSRKYAAAFFLSGIFLLAPAFPIAFNRIAWTPYAERYVYVASAFVAIATILFIKDRMGSPKQWSYAICAMATIIVIFSFSTWERNKEWQTNETLWLDTLDKSPGFQIAISEYGLVLMAKGQLDEALVYLQRASSHPNQGLKYRWRMDLDLAMAYKKSGDFLAAEKTYRRILNRTKESSIPAWHGLINLYKDELKRNRPEKDKKTIEGLLKDSQEKLIVARSDSQGS